MIRKWKFFAMLSVFAAVGVGSAVAAEKQYGVTDTEIKLGQTVPYSGPASASWKLLDESPTSASAK